MSARSSILNLLTCLTLAATGVVVVVAGLFLAVPGIVPGFLRVPTQPVQVSGLTAQPPATAGRAYPTLPPEWTATPSPQPTSSPTAAPFQTATLTASPGNTNTPAPTSTPRASATAANMLTVPAQANVRSGPSMAYPVLGRLSAGQTAHVIGRDSSAKWFAINYDGAPQGTGWVSSAVVSYTGSINDLPVIQAAAPPPPTAVPTITNTPNIQGAGGIQTLSFSMHKTTGSRYESLFFDFSVVNNSGSTINYGLLAAHTDQGVTAASWSAPLEPGKVLNWTDHINFPNTGTYQVYLGICYSSLSACKVSGSPWTRLSNSIAVTIQ